MHALGVALLLWASPNDFNRAFEQGLQALSQNRLASAQTSLEAASRIKPGDARVWLALAQTYWKSGKTQPAAAAAQKAEALGSTQPVVLHGLTVYYSESGDPGKAARSEARYAGLAPQDRDALIRAMDLYLEAKQPKPAILLARTALANQNRAELHHRLARAYLADGQFEKCAGEYAEAIRLDPYEEVYPFDLSQALLQRENFGAAAKVLEDARKVFDKSPQIELALGVSYYGQRRFEDAAEAFLRTIALAPQVSQPYLFLGRMLDQAPSRLPQILSRFSSYAQEHPKDPMAQFLYAKALATEGERLEQAEELLRRSLALEDGNWEAHYELALLLDRKRDFAGAAEQLRRGIARNPNDSAMHYRLARIYDRMGRTADAAAERALHGKLAAAEKAHADQRSATARMPDIVIK